MAIKRKLYKDGKQTIFLLTTDTKPTLSTDDVDSTCCVINDTTKEIDEIWGWSGSDWFKY